MTAQNNRRDIEHRLRRISRPEPSASLRDRILSGAVVTAQPITWSDRMWFSREWRLAAVAAAIAIVVLDQIAASPRPVVFTATEQSLAEAQVIDEAGRQLGLPPEVAASLARRALSEAPRTRVQSEAAAELLQELTREGGGD
jgi:hypothetical protein